MSREGYKMTELGEIPQEWEIKELKDVCPLQRGFDLPKDMLKSGQYPVVYSNGVLNYHNEFKAIGPGVITGRSGTIGKVTYVEDNYWPHNTALWVTDFLGNNPKFIYYYLSSLNLQKYSSGTGVPTLNRNDLFNVQMKIPPIKQQQKIADILSTVDQQIEQTDALIEKTKELKKGLMQRLLTKGIGHTQFRDTEIGQIPKGWEVKRLGDIAQICYGKNQKDVENENGKYKILGTGGVIGKTNEYLWDEPSVLIGRKGTIDKPMYIEEPFWTVDTLFYTKVNEKYIAKWLFYYLNKIDLKKYNEATGVPSLNVSVLNTIQLSVPPLEEQKRISAILTSVDDEINIIEENKRKLQQAKKALMQKLLTGKIRVKV